MMGQFPSVKEAKMKEKGGENEQKKEVSIQSL